MFRSQKYLEYIRTKRCLICSSTATEPHHEKLGKGGMGLKPPDSHCVPLCHEHHVLRHSKGMSIYPPHIDIPMCIISLLSSFLERRESDGRS